MKMIALGGGLLVLVLGVGYLATSAPAPGEPMIDKETGGVVSSDTKLESDAAVAEPGAFDEMKKMDEASADMNAAPAAGEEGEMSAAEALVAAAQPGSYATYSAAALAASTADTNVVFFHAGWCPSCRALDADIVANPGQIPAGVAIFKADYDSETKLKRDFGVVRQHSVVALDANGQPTSLPTHPATLAQLVAGL